MMTFALSWPICWAQHASGSAQAEWRQLLASSEADQIAWVKATVDYGLPIERGGTLNMLVLNRSAITLPILEKKIAEVLQSKSPAECFTRRGVDPHLFITIASVTITEAGDEHSLRAIGELLKLDERRFDDLVERTLGHAENYRNPFTVAYRGIDLGDAGVQKRVVDWASSQFMSKSEGRLAQLKELWAEAMILKYHSVPTEQQWTEDPIFAHMSGSQVKAIHDDIARVASEKVREGRSGAIKK